MAPALSTIVLRWCQTGEVRLIPRSRAAADACRSLARAVLPVATSNRAQAARMIASSGPQPLVCTAATAASKLSRARARSPRRVARSASCRRSMNSSSRDPSSFSAASASV